MNILAISPIDGRYTRYTKGLQRQASEFGLIRYRVEVMVKYVLALDDEYHLHGFPRLTKHGRSRFRKIIRDFSVEDADAIKAIETKGWQDIVATNHDVKACELWLRHKCKGTINEPVVEWIHFGCTSEDVNNIAYGLMLSDMLRDSLEPSLQKIAGVIEHFASMHKHLPMLSRTHGQSATPTTLGKEFAVFSARLAVQISQLQAYTPSLKLNSASGNYNALYAACPGKDWYNFSRKFITRLRRETGQTFKQSLITTQIEPHDTYAELFAILMRINTILIDFSQDIWRYVSDDWIVQRAVAGETGSSIMPHKVNPIMAENAEGNLGLANALMEYCCRKLPVSRLQRDLSDSTVERSFGTIFGHCIIAYENLAGFMGKISANEEVITRALNDHPEVLSEAFQTILRSTNYPSAYDALKSLARGKKITMQDLVEFVKGLDPALVDLESKRTMLSLTPQTYIGIAPALVGIALNTRP